MHCVDVKIEAGPTVNEQVLARFGCHMGLLWSPPVMEGATKGRFCFFDKGTDYSSGLTFNTYCSAAAYDTEMWHNAYVSIEECGKAECPGTLFVDGVGVRNFTTSWGPQDCSKPMDVSHGSGITSFSELEAATTQDSAALSVCPSSGDCSTCESSLRMGAGCLNKHNTFSHFDGLVDEFVRRPLYSSLSPPSPLSLFGE